MQRPSRKIHFYSFWGKWCITISSTRSLGFMVKSNDKTSSFYVTQISLQENIKWNSKSLLRGQREGEWLCVSWLTSATSFHPQHWQNTRRCTGAPKCHPVCAEGSLPFPARLRLERKTNQNRVCGKPWKKGKKERKQEKLSRICHLMGS